MRARFLTLCLNRCPIFSLSLSLSLSLALAFYLQRLAEAHNTGDTETATALLSMLGFSMEECVARLDFIKGPGMM